MYTCVHVCGATCMQAYAHACTRAVQAEEDEHERASPGGRGLLAAGGHSHRHHEHAYLDTTGKEGEAGSLWACTPPGQAANACMDVCGGRTSPVQSSPGPSPACTLSSMRACMSTHMQVYMYILNLSLPDPPRTAVCAVSHLPVLPTLDQLKESEAFSWRQALLAEEEAQAFPGASMHR